MKEQIKNLLFDLRKIKSEHGLMRISTIIEDAPIDELHHFANENKLRINNELQLLHVLYTPESGIDISIFSKKVSPVVEIGNEDYCAYDEKAQG